MIGGIEHLNSGTWSPAFKDVECTKAIDQKTCVWIEPKVGSPHREASLMIYEEDGLKPLLRRAHGESVLDLGKQDKR